MPGHDIIVIGASAGGVEALTRLVGGLPVDLPAALFVVLHVPAYGTSALPDILRRSGPLPAAHPQDHEEIRPGRIYVAPPDHHLLVKRGHVRLTGGPRENGHRPAADPLFRTAARAYGRRVVGVVLSGVLDDGTAGLLTLKHCGGVAAVQDPATALYEGMPRSALENVRVDHCLPVAELAPLLDRLARTPVSGGEPAPSPDMEQEADMAELDPSAVHDSHRPGTPSAFGCPDCGGVLWELHEDNLLRFRCRVGHAWSADSLLGQQNDSLESALWTALRALEEKRALAERLAVRARERGQDRSATHFDRQMTDAEQHAEVVRQVLLSRSEPAATPRQADAGA